ncbi:MAG: aspartate carbamoyltransferase regulatory subunit [Candidatus Doudnabacteria bacterium CG10_big_fil_rev_8_21_14_0_10_41_10]|uniref:Aspartate carbamoyltransferase regulatory chain n=1 Tax=Candidatus Doudnabacteria bacterium CG10_big_fil_rev_8_21_14_0_10_41_10 TaxID=1974551 RepID=A0A2H0VCM1_9BACT|nr:MAG: aspartate carbamoyltransferase regulatory subunit [Candidatus Doudnabacteria bacterium CG10_big_fil_rev_8_21_14_0_10_41_10]
MKKKPSNKTLSVSAIKEGTVIDHITAGSALKIIRLLNLPADKKTVTVGLNLPSRILGRKDIIKVSGREVTSQEANKIAVLAPQASINVIKNYKIIKKFLVQIPQKIEGVIVCPNPQCVTNHESTASIFLAEQHKYLVQLHCQYCEKMYTVDQIHEYHT